MNMLILRHFRALRGEGVAAFGPFGCVFEGHGPRSRLIRICVYFQNLKMISAQIISKNASNFFPDRQIISYIQTKRSGVGVEAV